MPSPRIERKLAAIMFTDIAGYTALSAKDETSALNLLDTQKQILTPIIKEFNGTLHKEIGDGLLFTFPTVTEAVKCGIKIQEETKANDDLNLRIGIHEGEITLKDGDALGDDVNVASRIETFSPSGGIAISSKVQQNISSLPEFETSYIGKPELKGVAQEVKVYCITSHGLPKADEIVEPVIVESKSNFNVFALTGGILTAIGVAFWIAVGVFDVSFGGKVEVPSVGILMMENLGEEEEEFWSSGMTADLITKVKGAGLIRVAPLDDILKLDKDLSIEEKAKKLRVKYILTHSFKIKEDGFELWSTLENIENGVALFSNKISEPMDMTTQMVGKLANDIITSLKVKTKQDIMKAPTNNAEAYEYYLKAKYQWENFGGGASPGDRNVENTEIARGLLQKAIEIDNNLLIAKSLLGDTYMSFFCSDCPKDYNKAKEIYNELLLKSKELEDRLWEGRSIKKMGDYYYRTNKNDKSKTYYYHSIDLAEEIGDIEGVGLALTSLERTDKNNAINYNNQLLDIWNKLENWEQLGWAYYRLGRNYSYKALYNKALNYHGKAHRYWKKIEFKWGLQINYRYEGDCYSSQGNYAIALEKKRISLDIAYERQDNIGIAYSFLFIGWDYYMLGNYNKALDYYNRELRIRQEQTDEKNIPNIYTNMGLVYFQQEEYNKAFEYFNKSAIMQMELDSTITLETLSYLFLSKKILGIEYNVEEIYILIKKQEEIEDYINFALFKLLEDTSYLETAYNQVKEKADNLEPDVAAKFLSYPLPKAIVEEWEKVK